MPAAKISNVGFTRLKHFHHNGLIRRQTGHFSGQPQGSPDWTPGHDDRDRADDQENLSRDN
jgi:hypothetical protein